MIGYADLDDDEEIPTEVFVVWEHLIGIAGPRYTQERFLKRVNSRWRRTSALDLFDDTNGRAVGELWHLWSRDVQVALVTYLPQEIAGDLAVRLAAESIPKTRLVLSTPNEMARLLSLLPDRHIFHSLPEHTLRYGPRGIYVHPDNPELMRAVVAP